MYCSFKYYHHHKNTKAYINLQQTDSILLTEDKSMTNDHTPKYYKSHITHLRMSCPALLYTYQETASAFVKVIFPYKKCCNLKTGSFAIFNFISKRDNALSNRTQLLRFIVINAK